MFLSYSSSSIKFYDHLQGVSAYQWFWNYGSQENLDSKILDSFVFLEVAPEMRFSPFDLYQVILRMESGFYIENPEYTLRLMICCI